eukprot:1505335-Pleurochrysis_carterae.AAC.2
MEARISQKVNAKDKDNYIYIDSASSHAEALFLQLLQYYCHHDIAAKPKDIDANQMKRGKIWCLCYHPARTAAQYEGFLRQFLPEGLSRKCARPAIDDCTWSTSTRCFNRSFLLVFRVIYKNATSMILSTTWSERFMLPCLLFVYEVKLGKQTIAFLSTDRKRNKLLQNWAQGVYSLEKQGSESSHDDTEDSEEEDELWELSLGESEDDDDDERSHPKAPKGRIKQSNIRPGSQGDAVRWTAVTDEDGFQAQAGSSYKEYVDPRKLKASHAGTSTSSMLSPIKETTERHEPGTVGRRGTRSAERRAPSSVEERTPNTTERHESNTQEDTSSTSMARIASSKQAKVTCDRTAPSSPHASPANAENPTPAVEKTTVPPAPRATVSRAPANEARPVKRKTTTPALQPPASAIRDETTISTAKGSTPTPRETTVPVVGNVAAPSNVLAPTPATKFSG